MLKRLILLAVGLLTVVVSLGPGCAKGCRNTTQVCFATGVAYTYSEPYAIDSPGIWTVNTLKAYPRVQQPTQITEKKWLIPGSCYCDTYSLPREMLGSPTSLDSERQIDWYVCTNTTDDPTFP